MPMPRRSICRYLQIAQVEDRLAKCRIASPIDGSVLVKYSEAGELAAAGRPLMKVADMSRLYLRAYFTSDQLARLKVGQEVTVVADFGGDQQREYGLPRRASLPPRPFRPATPGPIWSMP